MSYFEHEIDERSAQYGRFASAVLRTLKAAVGKRVEEGTRKKEVASRLGWDPSQLSRVINGRVENITIQTVSDILWACDFEPREFGADPIETIVANFVVTDVQELHKTGAAILGNTHWFTLGETDVVHAATGNSGARVTAS